MVLPTPVVSQPTAKAQGVPGGGVAGEEEGRSLYSVRWKRIGNGAVTKRSRGRQHSGAEGDTDQLEERSGRPLLQTKQTQTSCHQCSCTHSKWQALNRKIFPWPKYQPMCVCVCVCVCMYVCIYVFIYKLMALNRQLSTGHIFLLDVCVFSKTHVKELCLVYWRQIKKTLIILSFPHSRSLYIILHSPSKQGSGGVKPACS